MKKVIVLAGICAAAFGAWKIFSGGDQPASNTYGPAEFTPQPEQQPDQAEQQPGIWEA